MYPYSKSLTWRDVQYIIVYSSNPNIPRDSDAITNGAGLKVGSKYGFGVMDAAALINRARYWVNVPERLSCNIPAKLRYNIFVKINGINNLCTL